jgi:hypothetical protein
MHCKRLSFDCITSHWPRPWESALPYKTIALAAAVALGVALSDGALSATTLNAKSPLGMNLAGVTYYSSEQPFLNIFKTAGGWTTHGSSSWDTSEEQYLNLDSDGWPMTLTSKNEPSAQQFTSVGVVLARNLPSTANGYYPAGQYVVLYDGQGTLTYGFDASLVSSSAGRDVINATPTSGGIELRITATDPNHSGNYIRNIRVVQSQNEAALTAGRLFNPTFLSVIQKFRALRFMDWFQTNGSPLSTWSTRPVLTNAFWGTNKGVPVEAAVQLADAISADAWLNVPHMADDNYITQMATLVHAQLGAGQKVYVEFSNEVWNGVFAQYHYAVTAGQALWPAQPGGGGGYVWNRNWYGMRTAQMCDLWKSAWGADRDRVVCVLAAQAASAYAATASLDCAYWTSGTPCSAHGIGAVAIAPYFGFGGVPLLWALLSDGGLANLFQSLYSQNDPSIAAGGSLSQTSQWETAYITALTKYKLPMIAYESGQSYESSPASLTAPITNLYVSANRDARMGTAYTNYLQNWKTNGGQLIMLFDDIGAYGQFGEWGALESIMQTTTPLSSAPPKWQAIQNFISGNACWWSNCTGAPSVTPMAPTNLKAQ